VRTAASRGVFRRHADRRAHRRALSTAGDATSARSWRVWGAKPAREMRRSPWASPRLALDPDLVLVYRASRTLPRINSRSRRAWAWAVSGNRQSAASSPLSPPATPAEGGARYKETHCLFLWALFCLQITDQDKAQGLWPVERIAHSGRPSDINKRPSEWASDSRLTTKRTRGTT
jgi:hypothetical protein